MTVARAISPRPERLGWLDLTRLLCAVMILGIHWLRACYKAGLFGTGRPENLVMDYQGHSGGIRLFDYVLIAGTGHHASTWLTNVIGVLGGFGWEAVSALVLLSGFSLMIAQRGAELTRREWFAWYGKRAKRILVPFYLAAAVFLTLYGLAALTLPHLHGRLAQVIDAKMLGQFHTPLLGVVISHVFLFDPFNADWSADFFAPAWWFVPAILLAYLTYPFVRAASRFGRGIPLLAGAAALSIGAFSATNAGWLMNEQWYYIVLQESFNFALGVALGGAWLGAGRARLERIVTDPRIAAIALLIFVAGNLANWTPAARPLASMLYGPSLTVMLAFVATRVQGSTLAHRLAGIDPYDLYLVHQPFAFPIALVAAGALRSYAVFGGWLAFVTVAALAAKALSFAQRPFFARRSAHVTNPAPALPQLPAGATAHGATKQYANVQGLRAIAAMLVFGLHLNVLEGRFTGSAFLNAFAPIGNWGVDLFFVISGFVMITSTWNDFATPGISGTFFLRRLVRIYPPYLLVLVPIAALYFVAPAMVNASQAIKPSVWASFLLLPQSGFGLLIVSWTLVYELFFYVVFALVLTFARRYCLPLMGLWAVVTLAIAVTTRGLHNVYLDTYANPLMLEFVAGVLAGYAVALGRIRLPLLWVALGTAAILAAAVWYVPFDAAHGLDGSLRFALIGVPMALIFTGVVGLETNFGWRFPAFLLVLGNASYSLYLWHAPLSVLVGRLSESHRSLLERPFFHAAWLILVAAFVIGTSIALYYWIERPMLRFFNRRLRSISLRRTAKTGAVRERLHGAAR